MQGLIRITVGKFLKCFSFFLLVLTASCTGEGDGEMSVVRLPCPEGYSEIGDFVWHDENENGIQEPGESGLEGVIVNLRNCSGDVVETTTTDSSGYYLFTVEPGEYQVEFVPLSGWVFSPPYQGIDIELDSNADIVTGMAECTTLDADEVDTTWDAGLYQETHPEECGECEGKVIELTLQYNGDAPAFVQVYEGKKQKDNKLLFERVLEPSEMFTFYGIRRDGTMSSEISVWVDEEMQTRIHTSCSRPIGPGLIQGDFEVISGRSRFGGLLCPIEDGGWCEIGKPAALTFRYTGQSCDFTHHDQDPRKVECSGDPAFATRVLISASDNRNPEDRRAQIYFEGEVELDDTFEIDARLAGRDKFRADTFIFIRDLSGELLQSIRFHTSCSQPLNEEDQFGSIVLIDFTPES